LIEQREAQLMERARLLTNSDQEAQILYSATVDSNADPTLEELQSLTELSEGQFQEQKELLDQDQANWKTAEQTRQDNLEAVEEITKELQKQQREENIAKLLAYIGKEGLTAEQLGQDIRSGSNLEYYRKLIREGGVVAEEAALANMYLGGGVQVSQNTTPGDFIYQGDGTARGRITPLLSADEFYGAKPGGAIAQALRGGGGKNVVININGGNEDRVYQVVSRVLRETGYGNLKSYN